MLKNKISRILKLPSWQHWVFIIHVVDQRFPTFLCLFPLFPNFYLTTLEFPTIGNTIVLAEYSTMFHKYVEENDNSRIYLQRILC